MVKEGQAHADEDKKKKELVEVRNEADNLIYTTEKSLKDYGDKISQEDRKAVEDELGKCKKGLESNNLEEIRTSIGGLSKASHKLAEEVYKASSAGQSGPENKGDGSPADAPEGDSASSTSDETVVDAEFEETDKK